MRFYEVTIRYKFDHPNSAEFDITRIIQAADKENAVQRLWSSLLVDLSPRSPIYIASHVE